MNQKTDSCQQLQLLTEGKCRLVYQDADNADVVLIRAKEEKSRNGATRKAALATSTTCNVYQLLNSAGLPTHFMQRVDLATFRAHRTDIIPLAVVVRRIATGSYLNRFQEYAEGKRFRPPLVEFFPRDDVRHDPHLEEAELLRNQVVSADELGTVKREALRAFAVLERAWALRDVVLVDFKVEFGRDRCGQILLADVIDHDSWRIWPGGARDDKVDNYTWVADETESFVKARVGRAVLFRSATADEGPEQVHALFRELHYLGISCEQVSSDDLLQAVRQHDSDGQPQVGLIFGPRLPGLQEAAPYPIVFVGNPDQHDSHPSDAVRRAVWQAARILAIAEPALFGLMLGATG